MRFRSLLLGLALGLVISGLTYYVAHILRAGYMTGGYFPLGVFGSLVVAVLAINPLLRLVRLRPLSGAELGVAAAVALAACTWPGQGLLTKLAPMAAWQPYLARGSAGYGGANLLSYFPGGRGEVAEGQVRDWDGLAAKLLDPDVREADPLARRLWDLAPPDMRERLVAEATGDDPPSHAMLLQVLNRALVRPTLLADPATADFAQKIVPDLEQQLEGARPDELERLHRRVLDAAWADLLVPMPEGEGLLVAHGTMDRGAIEPLALGTGERVALDELPWDAWWPTIRLWGGVSLALAGACLCMTLIVHRQWSRHELLTYPIARFVTDLTRRSEAEQVLPDVARSKLFWIGLLSIAFIDSLAELHLLNPAIPQIPLTLTLTPLRELFPTAARVPGSFGAFEPKIIPITVGLAFFLPRAISFSIGIGTVLWLAFGSTLLSFGVVVAYDSARPQAWTSLAAGSYIAAAVMIVYLGRAEYGRIVLAALGLDRQGSTPRYAGWAMRGLVLCAAALIAALMLGAGMDWLMASLFAGLMLLILLVLGRMTAEAGLYMATTSWEPAVLLFGILGPAAVGPAIAVAVAMFSKILLRHDTLMPLLVNAVKIGESAGGVRPGRLAPWLGTMLVSGLVVAFVVTMLVQYQYGLLMQEGSGPNHWGSNPLPTAAGVVSELHAQGRLTDVLAQGPLDRLANVNPEGMLVGFVIAGFVVFVACSVARLRLPWWPLHPILFLFWGQWNFHVHAFSFLLGWMMKAGVMSVGGKRGYDATVPLILGVIAGQLLGDMSWWLGGLVHAVVTG